MHTDTEILSLITYRQVIGLVYLLPQSNPCIFMRSKLFVIFDSYNNSIGFFLITLLSRVTKILDQHTASFFLPAILSYLSINVT